VIAADDEIGALVERVAALLAARDARLATAESCTGGWLAKSLTDLPGSSAWFEFGFVTYGNLAKEMLLAVDPELIEQHGAVSREVAVQMAVAARAISDADLAVAVTGIAGPDGGTADKPVGTVWLAWDGPDRRSGVRVEMFSGDRESVRRQAVVAALHGVLRQLADG
jgi:nicotinamide-nucleotide amidase